MYIALDYNLFINLLHIIIVQFDCYCYLFLFVTRVPVPFTVPYCLRGENATQHRALLNDGSLWTPDSPR
jgi:hypothetical protein